MAVLVYFRVKSDIKIMDNLMLEKQFRQRGEIQSEARLSGIQDSLRAGED